MLLYVSTFPIKFNSHIPSKLTSFSGTSPLNPHSHIRSSLFLECEESNLPINPPAYPFSKLNDKSNNIKDLLFEIFSISPLSIVSDVN